MTTTTRPAEYLRQAALDYLWMHHRDWLEMAEEGGPMIISDSKGVKVTDIEGRSWIDVNGGYASVNAGFGQTEIAEAARDQMLKLPYFPEGATTEPAIRLAEKLAQIAPGNLERVWPCSGGSEATETAIKMARAYHRRNGEPERFKIVSRKGSYHGGSAGVKWAGKGGHADYEPAYPGFIYAPQPNPSKCEMGGQTPSECAILCAQAVADLIEFHGPKTVAAFIGEPVSGAAGAAVPWGEYWPMVREICDDYGVVLIADEVVCGFGRTGKMFGMDHFGVVPDVMAAAKGLVSSYIPCAAAIATKDIADAFAGEDNIFRHTLSSGGNPVAAAAALKNIEIIERDGLVQNSADMGAYMLEQLRAMDHPTISEVRGIGLMLRVDLVHDQETKAPFPEELHVDVRLSEKFRERGLILRGGSGISMHPPLVITRDEVDEIVEALDWSIGQVESEIGV